MIKLSSSSVFSGDTSSLRASQHSNKSPSSLFSTPRTRKVSRASYSSLSVFSLPHSAFIVRTHSGGRGRGRRVVPLPQARSVTQSCQMLQTRFPSFRQKSTHIVEQSHTIRQPCTAPASAFMHRNERPSSGLVAFALLPPAEGEEDDRPKDPLLPVPQQWIGCRQGKKGGTFITDRRRARTRKEEGVGGAQATTFPLPQDEMSLLSPPLFQSLATP